MVGDFLKEDIAFCLIDQKLYKQRMKNNIQILNFINSVGLLATAKPPSITSLISFDYTAFVAAKQLWIQNIRQTTQQSQQLRGKAQQLMRILQYQQHQSAYNQINTPQRDRKICSKGEKINKNIGKMDNQQDNSDIGQNQVYIKVSVKKRKDNIVCPANTRFKTDHSVQRVGQNYQLMTDDHGNQNINTSNIYLNDKKRTNYSTKQKQDKKKKLPVTKIVQLNKFQYRKAIPTAILNMQDRNKFDQREQNLFKSKQQVIQLGVKKKNRVCKKVERLNSTSHYDPSSWNQIQLVTENENGSYETKMALDRRYHQRNNTTNFNDLKQYINEQEQICYNQPYETQFAINQFYRQNKYEDEKALNAENKIGYLRYEQSQSQSLHKSQEFPEQANASRNKKRQTQEAKKGLRTNKNEKKIKSNLEQQKNKQENLLKKLREEFSQIRYHQPTDDERRVNEQIKQLQQKLSEIVTQNQKGNRMSEIQQINTNNAKVVKLNLTPSRSNLHKNMAIGNKNSVSKSPVQSKSIKLISKKIESRMRLI